MLKPYYKAEKLHKQQYTITYTTIQHSYTESCQGIGSGEETRCHLSIQVDINQRYNLCIHRKDITTKKNYMYVL